MNAKSKKKLKIEQNTIFPKPKLELPKADIIQRAIMHESYNKGLVIKDLK